MQENGVMGAGEGAKENKKHVENNASKCEPQSLFICFIFWGIKGWQRPGSHGTCGMISAGSRLSKDRLCSGDA
jgi:hypothetical protein